MIQNYALENTKKERTWCGDPSVKLIEPGVVATKRSSATRGSLGQAVHLSVQQKRSFKETSYHQSCLTFIKGCTSRGLSYVFCEILNTVDKPVNVWI